MKEVGAIVDYVIICRIGLHLPEVSLHDKVSKFPALSPLLIMTLCRKTVFPEVSVRQCLKASILAKHEKNPLRIPPSLIIDRKSVV